MTHNRQLRSCLVSSRSQPDEGGEVVRGPESQALLDLLRTNSVTIPTNVGPDQPRVRCQVRGQTHRILVWKHNPSEIQYTEISWSEHFNFKIIVEDNITISKR